MTAIRHTSRELGPSLRRLLIAAVLSATLALALAGTTAGHGLTVTTPGGEELVDQPVSTAWAQAHCNAEAPARATASSDGTVTFTPDEALPCPDGPGEGTPGR